MKTFVTPYNGTHKTDKQIIKGKSVTLPDETLTIRQIFQKFANGAPLDGKEEVYFEDTVYRQVDKMDLADVEQLKDQAIMDAKEAEERLDRIAAEKKKKRQQKIEQQQQQNTPPPPQPPTPILPS